MPVRKRGLLMMSHPSDMTLSPALCSLMLDHSIPFDSILFCSVLYSDGFRLLRLPLGFAARAGCWAVVEYHIIKRETEIGKNEERGRNLPGRRVAAWAQG